MSLLRLKTYVAGLACFAIALGLSACVSSPPPDAYRENLERMEYGGDVYLITLWTLASETGDVLLNGRRTPRLANQMMGNAWKRFQEIHACASASESRSEVTRLRVMRGNELVPVSSDLFLLLDQAMKVEALNPFSNAPEGNRPRLFRDSQSVWMEENTRLPDLEGVATGAALDEMVALAARAGGGRVMVEGAGVWRVGSKPPGQPGWAIRPFQGEASVILLPNRALAVRSCDNGGEFAPTRCWVIASSAVEAHAIAQFVCKMNPSDVRGWLETLAGAQARFEMPDETGFIRIYETPGFRSQILFSGDNTSR